MRNAAIAALLSFNLIVGCAGSSNEGIKGLSQDDADRLNSGRSHFDATKDPAFTPATRFAAGQLAESQGAPQAAVAQYDEALKLDPKHQPSLYRLGVVCAQLKMYPQAIEAWKRYVEATNGSPAAYGNLGFCYELAGRMTDAEAAYQKGIERDPKSVSCRVNYGLMLVRRDRLEEGLAQLQAVLPPAQARYNIASVYEQMNRKPEARQQYEAALKLDPSMDEAKVRLAAMTLAPSAPPHAQH
jgi:tetratricopeptide (TPR) repeat protein